MVGAVAVLDGFAANGQNIAFLVALAFAVAASANLPTILYSLFWKRFNTRGCLSMFPNSDWSWFPLSNPSLVSFPACSTG